MSDDDIFNHAIIRRLGELNPQDRRLIAKMHRQKKPPGYIFGYVHADRQERNGKAKT